MIDPETQETPTQLPLPAGFLEPGTATEVGVEPLLHTPEAETDTTIDDLVAHFRAVQAAAEKGRPPQDRLSRLRRGLLRGILRITHGATPQVASDPIASPRISIVLPVLDGASRYDAAIAALRAQAYPDLEIILATSLPASQLSERLGESSNGLVLVRLDRHADLEIALRRGWARASGEVLGWLGGDAIPTRYVGSGRRSFS